MDVRWFSAEMISGVIWSREIPLMDVRASGGFGSEPGTLSAQLNVQSTLPRGWVDMTDSEAIPHALEVADCLAEGKQTLVAIREDVYAGTVDGVKQYTKAVVGEWMIDRISDSHRDPIVRIEGVEVPGYLGRNVIPDHVRGRNVDSVVRGYELIVEGMSGCQLTHSKWANSALTTDLDYTKGTTTYAAIVAELTGTGWTWNIVPTLSADGRSVSRLLRYGAPNLDSDMTGNMLESTPMGRPPAAVLDWSSTRHAAEHTQEVWMVGAGAGSGQKIVPVTRPRPAGMPRMSATVQARDALTTAALQREGQWALNRMARDEKTITAEVRMSYLPPRGPAVGDTYSWESWPTLTKPIHERGIVRCLGWEWSQPRAGEIETATLTLERVS